MLGLLAIVVVGTSVMPARAADEPSQPYIILVGIDKYADAQILPRANAEADAKALYDVFTGKSQLGIDPKRVKLLLGTPDEKRGSEPATKANILKALHWASSTAGKQDLVILGLFMQGGAVGERPAYFASDSTYKGRDKNAIAAGDIEHELEDLKSLKFIAFLDVNFVGYDPGKDKKIEPAQMYREYFGKEDAKVQPSRMVFAVNTGLKPSFNHNGHGLFAQVIIDAFKGKADTEGYEPDGLITASELAKYVRKEMPARLRDIAKTDDEKGQRPLILDFQTTDFVVERNPAAYPAVKARLERFEAIAKKDGLSKEVIEEGVNLLSRMPKLENQQRLRKAYQGLADGKMNLAGFKEERSAVETATRLPERDADHFAGMIMKAVTEVREGFFKETNSGSLVEGAISGLYTHLNEKLPSGIKMKLDNAKDLKEADLLKLLVAARTHLGKREDLADGGDVTQALQAMLSKIDRHAGYYDPATVARMKIDLGGRFTGIGVQIQKSELKDALRVVTPIKDSPAYKAGIQTNDLITTIVREVDSEGKPLAMPEVLSTKGMTTEDAVKKILGKGGTKVKLVIERDGKQLEFNLVRGKVEVESVLGAKRNDDDSWNYVVDPESKICYVRLTQFSANTARDLDKVMRKLQKAGIKGFILDLRFNPGGYLDAAVKISDLFIDDGTIVTIRPRGKAEISYIGKSDGSLLAFPMVCLVNGGSASASEIVSACLQDHHRAIIMGSRSYGKGSVQTIHEFGDGQLKMTTATFWRPNGKNLNKASTSGRDMDEWGVSPDAGFSLEFTKKELGDLQDALREAEIIRPPGKRDIKIHFQDRQLQMALDYLRNQIKTASKNGGAKKAG
jgi:C-terminal peptidase prc